MPRIQLKEKTEPAKPFQNINVVRKPLKDTYLRTKQHREQLSDSDQESASEYASDQTQYMVEDAVFDAGSAASSAARATVRKGRDAIKTEKYNHQVGHQEGVPPSSSAASNDNVIHTHPHNNQSASGVQRARQAYRARSIERSVNTPFEHLRTDSRAIRVQNSSISNAVIDNHSPIKLRSDAITPCGTTLNVRAVGSGINAQKHPHIAMRTPMTSSNTAQAAAQQSYQTAKAAIQTAKNFAQKTTAAAKTASTFLVSSLKAAITGMQGLINAIAAGGSMALVIVVIIFLVGLIVGSSFGIFFSSEDTGSVQTMQEVVQEINEEYVAKLEEIKTSISHDELEIAGARAVWPEVLAVYAVKTTTDPNQPQEVASITDEKIVLLKEIFWQMNSITHRTDTVTETIIVESDDGNGNIVEDKQQITNTYLYITVNHKTADEIANDLRFNNDQVAQLDALLADENNLLWTSLLYGITSTDGQIVAVALSQVGNIGGEPYWSWYGFGSRVEWCACFVSWCANECGYIEAGVIPKFAACVNGVAWFQNRAQWLDNSAEPTPGMIIFFDWNKEDEGGQDGRSDHVGIVEKVENGRVYTVEGNSSNRCKQKSYPLGHYEILGYGIPVY